MYTKLTYRAMRVALAIVVTFAGILVSQRVANARTVKVTIVLGQGRLDWNGLPVGKGCKCTPNGDNCKITTVITYTANVTDGGNQWQFDGNVSSAVAEVTPGTESQFTTNITGENFPFPSGSYLDVPSEAFDGVSGFHIPLDNIVCDINGNFSGSIPK